MPPPVLLTAKLFPPPFRAGLVSRPRLTQKFEDGLQVGRKVTIVCAPAGFGKTTLVVEWLEHLRHSKTESSESTKPFSTAWLSLESSDDDLLTFARYLLATLQSIHPGIGQSTLEMLAGGRLPPHEILLLPLLNDLHTITSPFVLVLDDYHTIQDPKVHEALIFLLERQPASMHTILTTRQDPLLPLARWRARGQLTDIRLGELRFNETEAAEFLNQTMSLDLVAADIAALETRTEGWIAGLQMAAISLQQTETDSGNGNASEFIRAFAGDDRFIMDYLVDEVLSRQPQDVQEFLLKTSILKRFNASLCQAVISTGDEAPENSGEKPVSDQLAYLERANLFLIPLDNRRQWFRYHHLFAELLNYRLTSLYGSSFAASLQRKASQWCEDNDLPDQAIGYAQDARDWDLAAQLILKHSPSLIRQGEVITLAHWIRAIPDPVIRLNPFLCRDYGYTLSHLGHLKMGERYLQLAEQGFAAHPDLLGGTLAFASYNALFRGEFAQQIDMARRSLELLLPENTWMRAVAALSLGMGLLHHGEPQNVEAACQEAFQAGEAVGAFRTCVNALDQMGRVSVLRLDFNRAESYFRRATQYQMKGRPYAGCDLPFFDLAMLQYEQNDLEQAMASTQLGLEANQRSGSVEMRAYGWRLAARIHQIQGNSTEAEEHLQKALQLSAAHDLSPLTLSLNAASQVEMDITRGDLQQAERAAPHVTNSRGVYPFIFYPETARVHLLLRQGKKAQALELLEPVVQRAAQPGWEYPRLQVRVLQALAASEAASAHFFLKEALLLAQPAGAVRTFLDLGEPLRGLIRDLLPLLDPLTLKAYAQKLLALFPAPIAEKEMDQQPTACDGLVEPLSEREIEVLRLIANGLSNTEIAQKLYLSTNTLKAHTQNIYTKLDVHSRVQAVNRARELGIL